MGGYNKEKAAARRAYFLSQGLTSKGKERKPRAIPKPHQAVVFSPPHKRKPAPKRAKVETPEQRRERGRLMRSSPLGLEIEESVRRRVKAMGE